MSIEGQGHFFTIYFPGFVLYKAKKVSVYKTIGPLVSFSITREGCWFKSPSTMYLFLLFSSPELKAHGELIVYQSSRHLSVYVAVCLSVNIFKLEYLRNQWVNRNQILSEAGERMR